MTFEEWWNKATVGRHGGSTPLLAAAQAWDASGNAERAAVVAWLRGTLGTLIGHANHSYTAETILDKVAEQIEAGEHREGG